MGSHPKSPIDRQSPIGITTQRPAYQRNIFNQYVAKAEQSLNSSIEAKTAAHNAKNKRSISRAQDPKFTTPAAIYATQGAVTIDTTRRSTNIKKNTAALQHKHTIEIEPDLQTLQGLGIKSPQNITQNMFSPVAA
jgi:hypothetical protein